MPVRELRRTFEGYDYDAVSYGFCTEFELFTMRQTGKFPPHGRITFRRSYVYLCCVAL